MKFNFCTNTIIDPFNMKIKCKILWTKFSFKVFFILANYKIRKRNEVQYNFFYSAYVHWNDDKICRNQWLFNNYNTFSLVCVRTHFPIKQIYCQVSSKSWVIIPSHATCNRVKWLNSLCLFTIALDPKFFQAYKYTINISVFNSI